MPKFCYNSLVINVTDKKQVLTDEWSKISYKLLVVNWLVLLLGFVRKSGMMKIVHEKYKSARKYVDPVISEFQASFGSAIEYNKELDTLLNKAQVCTNYLFF